MMMLQTMMVREDCITLGTVIATVEVHLCLSTNEKHSAEKGYKQGHR